jgi:hypothetical protein
MHVISPQVSYTKRTECKVTAFEVDHGDLIKQPMDTESTTRAIRRVVGRHAF